ncbi:BMC domain-containing protein [Anaerococcus vaginalis]|uniref:BMC domain-containing protein n=1 Tax=Anaerococcus vaginalis TaxID=33037 RepID=UPI002912847E|nr:BMC domain-containing protein [Anaerococcus vaginalis]MDU5461528.1 BMC domain-containing protein [Anaerococcus vaginalis]
MQYESQAIGLIETLGMLPAIKASADVKFVSYENVGSTLVTVIVRGDVSSCMSAVKAGVAEGEKIGKITAHNVMKRPVTNVSKVISVHKVED